MKPTFYKGIALGAAVSMLVLLTSAAVAGTGIGSVFNLGTTNTVDATSALSGTTAGGPQLRVTNKGTGALAQGIAASNNSTTAGALFARNAGGGPAASFSTLPGTAPFNVGSTGKVNYLNSDLLDGLDASAFMRARLPLNLTGAANNPDGVVSGRNTTGTGNGVLGVTASDVGSGVAGINSGGGIGTWGQSAGNNGVQGTSASAGASGVYGENTSAGGYGIAGRAGGASGIGLYGDNTAGGYAGYFTGKTHVGGELECAGCVGSGALAAEAKTNLQTHAYQGLQPFGANVPSPNAAPASMVSVSLPAGTYLVMTRALFFNNADNFGQNNGRHVECWTDPGGRYSNPNYPPVLLNMATGTQATANDSAIITLAAPGTASFDCRSQDGPAGGSGVSTYVNEMVALRIDQLN